MENDYRSYFESILDIYPPWSINNISIDERQSVIHVKLSRSEDKSIISFFTKKRYIVSDSKFVNGYWQHCNLGNYRCFISADVPVVSNTDSDAITRDTLSEPAFLGHPNKKYTHQLRQVVALNSAQGLSKNEISTSHNIETALVGEILGDVANAPENVQASCYIPTESDIIWQNILFDKTLIKTQSFPLKLLLSKLKLAAIDTQKKELLRPIIIELREFFIQQAASLKNEISQISGLAVQQDSNASRRRSVHKLILPAVKNPVWVDILMDRIHLDSNNMPLNLLLVKLRSNYKYNQSEEGSEEVVGLREFFRKNYQTLRKELVQINRLLQTRPKQKFTLPDSRHDVWRQILKDDSFIPSQHMAYKLLLSKLRSDVLLNPSPNAELSAAKRIRQFIADNQQTMQQELRQVIKSSSAV